MNEDEEIYDIGHNAEELGFVYLFLKYLLPIIVGFIGILLVFVLGVWFLHFITSLPQAPAMHTH